MEGVLVAFCGGHLLLGLFLLILMFGLISVQTGIFNLNEKLELLFIFFVAVLVCGLYFVFCTLAVWRCGAQHPSQLWRWASRGMLLPYGMFFWAQVSVMGFFILGIYL
ncbi:hypothetical protein [Comamonas sp. NoAH]|uniref:hypothetical protein n=1 Tax=Comamonas halotolerans TaxID=3041496 RepID=UPI0024E13E2A|nr:hypothetical protein [Comamonas sp. NoAH]